MSKAHGTRFGALSARLAISSLVLLGGPGAPAQDPVLTTFRDGFITWTNTDPDLYYTVEFMPNMTGTDTWSGFYHRLQDIRSSDNTITAPVGGVFYRVVGSSTARHTRALAGNSQTVAAGYYEATTLSAVDPDLVTANIRAGKTIFGVTGTPEVVDTSSGDAAARDIMSGKKAWVRGVERSGTIVSQYLSAANEMVFEGYYEQTLLSAVDPDLTNDNIKQGVAIFGVTGAHLSAQAERSGQTTSYTGNDDGWYQEGVEWPNPRFTAGTGTSSNCVRDNLTGLMWLRNPDATARDWTNALLYCETLTGDAGRGGLSDWRLPNIKELLSLVDYGQYNLALPSGHPFIGIQDAAYYWSSTTLEGSVGNAWYVFIHSAVSGFRAKTNEVGNYAWPVRGGE